MEESLIFDGKRFITTAEAGKYLSCTSDYIASFCRAGELVCKRVGKSWFVEEDSLLEFKEKKELEKKEKKNRLKETRKAEYQNRKESSFDLDEEIETITKHQLPQTPSSKLSDNNLQQIQSIVSEPSFVSNVSKSPIKTIPSSFSKIPTALFIASIFDDTCSAVADCSSLAAAT